MRTNADASFREPEPPFPSFFLGGFECSSHRTGDGRRLDLIASTGHDRHVTADYARLIEEEIYAARDGVRWHLIEATPGHYDFASVRPMLQAARDAGLLVIWDLMHYGWPDDLDIFAPEFVDRFARFASAFARVWAEESEGVLWIAPVNEISFLAWIGGEVGHINPFAIVRGPELKAQLVRAAIAAIEAVWDVVPGARVAQVDPVFNIIAHPDRPEEAATAEAYRLAQFEAWDMLSGRERPELGGHPRYVDVIGVNYYPWNQWIDNGVGNEGTTIGPDHPGYRPFRSILAENFERYGRPIFVAETGTEGDDRGPWFRRIAREVRAAFRLGVPIEGICLYPIVNFPGWDNDRYCQNGLWDYHDEAGDRSHHGPLAIELARQTRRMALVRRRRSDPIAR